jgi:hypothetical protein
MPPEIDPNNPPVEIPATGSVAEKITALEKMENGLIAQLYNTKDKDEQELIGGKMDYIAAMLDKLTESQKAVEAAGKVVTQHQDGGFTPHDQIRALDVLMDQAAITDPSAYKMYRVQKRELVAKYGAPGPITSTSARNPKVVELVKIANNYQSENCGADITTRMEAAANAGDMATYKELRAQRRQQQA